MPTTINPFMPEFLPVAQAIIEWCYEFLIPDHPEMRRPDAHEPGPVCPFLKASLDEHAFYMVFHPEVNGFAVAPIEDLLEVYIRIFKDLPPHSEDRQKHKTLVICFPGIKATNEDEPDRRRTEDGKAKKKTKNSSKRKKQAEDRLSVLSKAAKNYKTRYVEQKLMLAAFYETCKDPSVHNPNLLTSQAPEPFIAIRHLRPHDILFLDEGSHWFDKYNLHYGHLWKGKKAKDVHEHEVPLLRAFNKAKQRFS